MPGADARSPWPVRLLVFSLWMLAMAIAGSAPATATPMPTAAARPDGTRLLEMQAVAAPADDAAEPRPPGDDAAWQRLPMPDRWRDSRPGFGGSVWYRAQVDFATAPGTPWAVYLPRAIMNAEVWVNGVLAGRAGRMQAPVSRHWNTPLFFTTPQTLWRQGPNIVHVRVVGHADGAGGLAPPQIGRADRLADVHARQVFVQNTLVYAANIAVIALGLFVFAVWLRKPERGDYGYFSAGALLWGLSNFNMIVSDVPLSYFHWELFVFVSIVWALLALGLFGLRFAGRHRPWLERAVVIYALACALVLWLSGETGPVRMGAWWLLPVLALGAWSMFQIVAFVRRVRLADYSFFAVVATATLSLGAHDWLLQTGMLDFEASYALPFMAPLLLAAIGWLIAGDYARAQQDLARMNTELADRVRQKEDELRESFARVADLERARAVAAERSRILRDMHDGVGTHLTSAIRQLQSGQAQASAVEQTLRDSLDQLKLSIDALTLEEGDVAGLLGALRFRLAPRLESAGLSLRWQVESLPAWPGGHTEALRHVQYIVFEAISNVLQHSGARTLTLSARPEPGPRGTDDIAVRIEDDGLGCTALAEGHGLRGMRTRARAIHATVDVAGGPGGGCAVTLRLPLRPIAATQTV
jgi:signal transduction histidine kinase